VKSIVKFMSTVEGKYYQAHSSSSFANHNLDIYIFTTDERKPNMKHSISRCICYRQTARYTDFTVKLSICCNIPFMFMDPENWLSYCQHISTV